MKTQHTQGEWKVKGCQIITDKKVIGEVFFNTRSKRVPSILESRENAKLIAAAPDLLTALNDIFKEIMTEGGVEFTDNMTTCLANSVHAIKKATE